MFMWHLLQFQQAEEQGVQQGEENSGTPHLLCCPPVLLKNSV